jgi:hypothetical protein
VLLLLSQEDEIAGQLPPPAEGFQQPSQMNDPYAQATRSGFLPPAADRQMPPWGMQQQQQQQQQPGLDAGASRWGLPPGSEQQPYGSYFGQQQQQPVRQPEGAFAGYEDPLLQQQRLQQQQQYGSLPPGMMGDAGFGSSSSGAGGGVYPGQQQYAQQLPLQQQPFGVPKSYQDLSWYADNAAAGYDQPPFGAAAGFTPDAAAAAGVGQYGLPGTAAGYPPLDGSTLLPLPPAAGEQQQQRGGQQQPPPPQQQQQPGGRPAYERVDDWE